MPEEMPIEFWQAIDQFNQGQFYECHDTLEALWMDAVDPLRRFYQGILQVAVACYHLHNANLRGATILLGEGLVRLKDYQPVYGGIEVTHLLTQSADLLSTLQQMDLAQPTQSGKPSPEMNSVAAILESGVRLPQIQRAAETHLQD